MIKVQINKKDMQIKEGVTVSELLACRNMSKAAVWINGRQLLRREYDLHVILHGDEVKILRIMAGG